MVPRRSRLEGKSPTTMGSSCRADRSIYASHGSRSAVGAIFGALAHSHGACTEVSSSSESWWTWIALATARRVEGALDTDGSGLRPVGGPALLQYECSAAGPHKLLPH